MKIGVMTATLLMVLVFFSGPVTADSVVKGKVILISGDMYTIKTQSPQGFEGSRETFRVDEKMTRKSGDIKLGTTVEAEVNINGTANWIRAVDDTNKPAGQ